MNEHNKEDPTSKTIDIEIGQVVNDAVEIFTTLAEVQVEHDALLEWWDEVEEGDEPADLFWDAVSRFAEQVQATGTVLDLGRERLAAQRILDYWGNALYRANGSEAPIRLASFDLDLAPILPDEPCPYQGLAAFDLDQQEFFFGRERLIREMLARLESGERLLAVVGASGSGKSSVVLAGLLSALQQNALPLSATWPIIKLTPGSKPLESLIQAIPVLESLIDLQAEPTVEQQTRITSKHFRDRPNALAHLLTRYVTLAGVTEGTPAIVVIDQFEELFTLCEDEEARQIFATQLLSAIQNEYPHHRVILTIRTDFVDTMVKLPELTALFRTARINADALDINELRAAIEWPANKVGLRFEEGIVDDLISTILGERAGLPLLQFTLLKLWQQRQRNRITHTTYQKVGNPLQALSRSADAFYDGLLPQSQQIVQRLLLRMVQPTEGREFTSRRIRLLDAFQDAEASNNVAQVLQRLIFEERLLKLTGVNPVLIQSILIDESGLITQLTQYPDAQIEVTHEALVRNWPRLVEWLDTAHIQNRRRLQITEDAERWVSLGHMKGALYSVVLLEEAKRIVHNSVLSLTSLEDEFFAASRTEIEEKQNQEIERRIELIRAETKAAHQSRQTKRLRIIIAVLVIPLLISLIFMLLEGQQRQSLWVPSGGFPKDSAISTAFASSVSDPSLYRYCIGTLSIGIACSNNGATWNVYQQGLPRIEPIGAMDDIWEGGQSAISALAINPLDLNQIYAYIWEKGIYKTEDGGLTWLLMDNIQLEDATVKKIAVHGDVVAGIISNKSTSETNLYISSNSGKEWTKIAYAEPDSVQQINDILIVPSYLNDEVQVWLATQTGLYQGIFDTNWQWTLTIALKEVRFVVHNGTQDGFYLLVYDPQKKQSVLYNWQQGKEPQIITTFDQEPRAFIASNEFPLGHKAGFLLLEDESVYSVAVDGTKEFLGRPPSSLIPFNLMFAHSIMAGPFLNREEETELLEGTRIWIGHSSGLLTIDDLPINRE